MDGTKGELMNQREQNKIRKQIQQLRQSLRDVEDAEWMKDAKAKVGKFYKYENAFDSERKWWLYGKILAVDPRFRGFQMFRFEECTGGDIRIHLHHDSIGDLRNWIEIPEVEFEEAYLTLLKRIHGRC